MLNRIDTIWKEREKAAAVQQIFSGSLMEDQGIQVINNLQEHERTPCTYQVESMQEMGVHEVQAYALCYIPDKDAQLETSQDSHKALLCMCTGHTA